MENDAVIFDFFDVSFSVLADISNTAIYITDLNGNCIYVNKSWCRMAGMLPGEAMGDGWVAAIHPEDRERISSEWNKFICGDMPWGSEYRFLSKGGEITWVHGVASCIEDSSKKYGIIGINYDISTEKKFSLEIEASELKYRSLFENSLDAILLTGSGGEIFEANPSACKMFGMTEKELCITGRSGVINSSDPRLYKALKIRDEKGRFSGEISLKRKDGIVFPGHITSSVFINDNGEERTSMIIRDISNSKAAEKKLKDSQRTLNKLAKHLADVRENERSQIGMDLHDDLGQKLTALNFDLAWLKSRIGVQSVAVNEKFEEMAGLITESIQAIKEVYSFLRPAMLYDLGIVPAFDWQIKKFEKQTGIISRFYCDSDERELDDHISLILYRIMQESITNIARHSKADNMEVRLTGIGGMIIMLISDNGIGISETQINSLNSMGIAGIKARVNSLHGKVLIQGEKDKGTTVRISIPIKKSNLK